MGKQNVWWKKSFINFFKRHVLNVAVWQKMRRNHLNPTKGEMAERMNAQEEEK